MNCSFKITKSAITTGLKEASDKYGIPVEAYISFINKGIDEDGNLTPKFESYIASKLGISIEELNSKKIDDVIKVITDEYNKFKSDINYSSNNESSYKEVARFGYSSVYARDTAKTFSTILTLSAKREVEEKYGSIDKYIAKIKEDTGETINKRQAYIKLLKSKLFSQIINRAVSKNLATKEEITKLITTKDVAAIEDLFGKDNVEDVNLLAWYKEFIANTDNFVEEAFKINGDIRKACYQNKNIQEIEEQEDIENAVDDEEGHTASSEEDSVDNYIRNLTNKLGDTGHYMSNIDDDIRLYFSTIPAITSTEPIGTRDNGTKIYQYDTNNPLGLVNTMDATNCINTILSRANAYNVQSLKDKIRLIAKEVPGMKGLVQVADFMDTNPDFAFKLWTNFSKTIMTKLETSNISGSFQARQSNFTADREKVLKYDFINSFKNSSITVNPNHINRIITDINSIKEKINANQEALKLCRKQQDKDKVNKEINDLINSLIPTVYKGLHYYFNTLQQEAIELFISKSENKINDIDFIIATLNTLKNQADKANHNYEVLNNKLDEAKNKKYKLTSEKNELEKQLIESYQDPNINTFSIKKEIKELDKKIKVLDNDISELYKTEYIEDNFRGAISPFVKAIVGYSIVKTDMNSRNVNGNLSSDLLSNSMITNILKTLQNPKALENFGKYRQQSRQYDFSNIMIEHRDEDGNIINYGLFTQNENKEFIPTSYAHRLLRMALYSGIADVDASEGVVYSKMSEPDYITSAIFNFFRNERDYDEENNSDGGPAVFANYFMRIPSDAPKNFTIRAPKYSIRATAGSEDLFKNKNKTINKKHPVYKQFRQAFIQEMQDAANAIYFIFNNPNLEGSIDISTENIETGAEPTRLRKLIKNYHYNGDNLFEKDKNGKLKLTGNVFSSDRFKITEIVKNEDGKWETKTINYGNKIIEEAFDFFYGGANSIKARPSRGGVELVLTKEQEEAIDRNLEEFIKKYSEQCYNRAMEQSHLFGEKSFDKFDLIEFALNYHLAYVNFNDMFEGDTKFYKSSQDALKRFKEGQGSGICYGILNYEDDLTADSSLVKDSILNKTTFKHKMLNPDGTISEEDVKIEQRTRFKAVTIKNTVRTGDSIGTFKLGKKGKPARFIRNDKGELVENDKGNYIFETKGRLSERLVNSLINSGMSENNANIHAANIMIGYINTTVNDAQSYITFEEWVRRVAARGQFNKYKPLIDAIFDESKPLDAKTISEFIQVQKNFYYDQHFKANLGVIHPRQIKNAEFVLVPRLIEGTQLKEVYDMMKEANIDQLNTEETSKAGKSNVLTIWDDNGDITEEAKKDFITNAAGAAELFNYNYLYTQQETPSHLNAKNKAGIQFMKKIIDNIDEKLPNGKPNPLYSLKQKFQKLYVENIISSAEELADTFDIYIDEKGNFVLDGDNPIDKSTVYELLKDEIARQGLDSNSLDYVTLDEQGYPIMPAYAGNFTKKLESIVQGLINNRITRQTLPGFHAAQITNIGFRPLNEMVEKRSYSTELKYHPDEYAIIDPETKDIIKRISEREYNEIENEDEKNKYTNIGASSYIEIMLPKSNFKFKRTGKNGKPKSDKELLQELINAGLDTIIGYRIPTEGKQSICVMKVVGFIDDTYDSTIVVPDDWVSQTGSDFDIDSVYGIHHDTQIGKDGKIIKAKPKTVTPQDYIKYIKKKLKRVLEKNNIETSVKEIIQEKVDKYNSDASDTYETLQNEADEFYKTMNYKAQNVIKKYNQVKTKGETKRDKYVSKLAYIIKNLNNELKTNTELSKKHKTAIKLYNNKLKEIYSFLKEQNNDFLDNLEEIKSSINEELATKLSEIAIKAGLPSYEKFKERQQRIINRNITNNELLDTAITILSDDSSLEENLSRSNFEKIIDARDSIQPEYIKEAREKRSPYNFFDQAAYQNDAMSGAKLKGASVARDTFVSICNTVKPYIDRDATIKVVYKKEDGYTLEKLKEIFPEVLKTDDGNFIVTHNTLGWTKNNKNVADLLLTPYTSQTTAHILDNIKEGAIPNVNSYSFNVYKTFSDIGCDYYTAVAFMMQPAVSRIIELNDRKNSIYAEDDGNNPIKTVIVELANKLFSKDKFNQYIKINAIVKEIEDTFNVKINDHVIDFSELNDRLNNDEDNTVNTLHDLKVALDFYHLKTLSDEISDNARLLNPDKFGAKQSVYETIDTIDKINEKKIEDSVLYIIDNYGVRTSLLNSIYTDNIKDSKYPPLNAFYKYSTQLSVNLSRILFTDIHSENFDKFMFSIDRYISKKLDENIYNSFRSYIISHAYKQCSSIKYTPNIDENGNINFDIDSNPRDEAIRIYGLNKTANLIVKDSDGNIKEFDVKDINNPTQEEINQFITLSPAQKVHYIRNKFSKKGIFEYIEESLTNRGKLGNKQTLKYNENVIDIETVYSEFEKAFFNSNPLIKLAAIDLVKYSYVVEGTKMKKGGVNKIIKNNVLTTSQADGGLGIVQESKNYISSLSDYVNIDLQNEIRLNFVRSHPNLITNKPIRWHKTGTFINNDQSKPRYAKDLIPTSQGIIIVNDLTMLTKYNIAKMSKNSLHFNNFIRLTDEGVTTLYRIHRQEGTTAILTPLNILEENESFEMSVNNDNNKYNTDGWYQAVIDNYNEKLIEQEREIYAIESDNETATEELNAINNNPKYSLNASINDLMAQADLRKYMVANVNKSKYAKPFDINSKNTPYTSGFETVIDAVIERFDVEKGLSLTITSNTLNKFINYPYKLYGSIQNINGTNYLIQKLNFSKKNEKYIGTDNPIVETNSDLKEIFTKAQHDGKPVRNAFSITKVKEKNDTFNSSTEEWILDDSNNDENTKEVSSEDIFYSSTEELNKIPDVNSLNHTAIETMYFRRRSMDDPRADDSLEYINRKNDSNNPNFITQNQKLITRVTADYVVNSVNDIITNIENFRIGENTYKIDSDEAITAIKTDPILKQQFLKTILDARAFAKTFSIIDKIDITSDDLEMAKNLKDIKNAITKLRSLNTIANAEVRFGNEVLTKLSKNPLMQKNILGIFDGYYTASFFDAWVNDLQETSNPLLQLVSSQVMKDLRKKEMLAKKEVEAFRKTLSEIKERAAKAGVKIDWDKIIDDEGKFIQAYNKAFLDKLQELRDAKEKAKLEIDTNPKAYFEAKLAFDKWKAENIHQEADRPYYDNLVALEEHMLNNYEPIFIKYKTLQIRYSELLSYISGGTLNPSYVEELDKIKKQLDALSSDFIEGDELLPKYTLDDPNNPYTGETKLIYSLESAYALRDYKHKKSELDEEYFEYETKFSFDKELERNLKIISEREKKDPNGRLLTPTSELMLDEDYVAAKDWIANNTYFSHDSEVRVKLNEAFKKLREIRNYEDRQDSMYVSVFAKLRNAYDPYGIVNARLFTDKDIEEIKRRQELEYGINETNPFSDRTLIANAPDDDVIFSSEFYNRMRSNGASNPEYMAKVKEINNILRSHYNSASRTINTSELTQEELDKLSQLYSELNDIKKTVPGSSTNGKSIFEFIQNEVDFVYNEAKYNEEENKAILRNQREDGYYKKWLKTNSEIVQDENGNDKLVPNHFLYGYAVPKGYKKGQENPFIDKDKTEALRYIKEHSFNIATEYYHQTYREMKAKSETEFKAWFDANHIYNPYTHKVEPLKCWTTLQVNDENKKEQYHPKFNYKNRKVKDDKRNVNYLSDRGYALNYNGTNVNYNNTIEQNVYEKEISNLFKSIVQKYAITNQAKSFFKQGYAPIRQKNEEFDSKKLGKELLKFIGFINNATGKEEWLEDEKIDYSNDTVIDMPMSTLLKNKDTVDIKYTPPVKNADESAEDYAKRYNEWYENKKQATEANREIHKKLLDKEWPSVMEEFIMKASNFNAIQDNKYLLFYAKNMIDNQQMYVKNLGFSKLKKTGSRTVDGAIEYASKTDENLKKQYINWIRKIVYDQYKKPNNKFTKFANTMQSVTSAKYMMLNVSGGIANITQGWTQILGERFANDYFGDCWWKGVNTWNRSIGSFIYDMHKTNASSLPSAIVQLFNVVDFTETNGLVRLPDASKYIERTRDIAFSTLSVGEHFMQNSALFAMLYSHRLFEDPTATENGTPKYTYKSIGQGRNEAMDRAFKEYIKGSKFEQMYEDFVKYETSKPDYKKEYMWYRKDFTTEFMNIYFKSKQRKEFNKIKDKIEKDIIEEFNDDSKHPTLMSQLDISKDGYLKFKDDSIFAKELKEEEAMEILADFKGRVISVNKKIHGIYDKLGAAMLENKWAGSLIMQYHKHVYPGIMKRWRVQGYFNEERGTVEKGSNIALLDFVALPFHKAQFIKKIKADNNMTNEQLKTVEGFQNICKSYLDFVTHFTLYFKMLPRYEQGNILRGLADLSAVAVAVTTAIATQVLGSDDEDSLLYNILINQADRLASESMAFRSIGILGEAKKLWSSPIAAQGWIEDIGQTLGLCTQYIMQGENFDVEYTSGMYKGENKFMMLLKRNTPIWHSAYMLERLNKNNKNYKLDENMLSIIPVKTIAEYIKD